MYSRTDTVDFFNRKSVSVRRLIARWRQVGGGGVLAAELRNDCRGLIVQAFSRISRFQCFLFHFKLSHISWGTNLTCVCDNLTTTERMDFRRTHAVKKNLALKVHFSNCVIKSTRNSHSFTQTAFDGSGEGGWGGGGRAGSGASNAKS